MMSTVALQVSAAERVKLRRESKKSGKKQRLKPPLDEATLERRRTPTVKFKERSQVEEMSVLYMMWDLGLDLEDMKVKKVEFFCSFLVVS